PQFRCPVRDRNAAERVNVDDACVRARGANRVDTLNRGLDEPHLQFPPATDGMRREHADLARRPRKVRRLIDRSEVTFLTRLLRYITRRGKAVVRKSSGEIRGEKVNVIGIAK